MLDLLFGWARRGDSSDAPLTWTQDELRIHSSFPVTGLDYSRRADIAFQVEQRTRALQEDMERMHLPRIEATHGWYDPEFGRWFRRRLDYRELPYLEVRTAPEGAWERVLPE